MATKKRKVLKTLDDVFDDLVPYLRGITIDEKTIQPVVQVIFPKTWKILKNIDFFKESVQASDVANFYYFSVAATSEGVSITDLIEYVQDNIDYNLNLEEKQRELQEIIKAKQEQFQKDLMDLKSKMLPEDEGFEIEQYIPTAPITSVHQVPASEEEVFGKSTPSKPQSTVPEEEGLVYYDEIKPKGIQIKDMPEVGEVYKKMVNKDGEPDRDFLQQLEEEDDGDLDRAFKDLNSRFPTR